MELDGVELPISDMMSRVSDIILAVATQEKTTSTTSKRAANLAFIIFQ